MAERALPISAEMVVEDVLDRHPSTARTFLGRRMHCVGCPIARFETIAEVCQIYRQPLGELLAELNAAATGGDRPFATGAAGA